MKRFALIIFLTFGKWGFWTFLLYFVLFYVSMLQLFSFHGMSNLVLVIEPYYISMRYMSFIIHSIVCLLAIRFVLKYVKQQNYIIRKKTFAFLCAGAIIQFVSYFCSIYILPLLDLDVPAMRLLLERETEYFLYWIEFISIVLMGYMLPFYLGALARGKFETDVVFLSKVEKK